MLNRFVIIKYLIINFLLLFSQFNFAAENNVNAVRVWPASDYTRVTIESALAISNDQMMLQNPERIVIDLKDIVINDVLKNLSSKVIGIDPNIKKIRVAQFNPRVTRVVIDLKASASVKIFSLKPIKKYKHRLVIDVYPKDKDEIASLLKQLEKKDNKKVLDPQILNSKKTFIVAIDAGHGGEDPGAVGAKGTKEKVVNLQISQRIKRLIDKEPFMKAVLIRTGDYFIPLGKRVSKARKIKADIFISIHADAFKKRAVRGSSVFALSERGATSAFAKFLANNENEADLIGGVSIDDKEPILARTLLDLSQSATINDSLKLGKNVLLEIKTVNRLHKKRVEQAGFAVLKAPDIPSILIETAFISNRKEERNLVSKSFQQKISMSIFKGIKRYYDNSSPIAFYTKYE
ncbi:MAG: N-acetylmuramoyl-L-alanine amidase [Nitrosomonadales bacterium]|nr:N-acetylmuramoyl-L-alanine amidase [Nitrosomonadales bacterium]|tara:strand:+ start:7499 stop:8713 length:1215 start_codon:yes stop_codon:yes gene_type:complete